MNPLELPPLTKHVTDLSGVLGNQQAELLSTKFAEHENATTEQVLTVLIPHRQWHELRDIWLKLFNENGIGQRDLNNGLLLIVSTEEKKLRIVTGKGMEIKYNEMVCREIVEKQLRPLLDAGKYEEMITRWREIIRGDLAISLSPPSQESPEDLIATKISELMRTKHLIPIFITTISCFALTKIIAIFSLPISMFLEGLGLLAVWAVILYGARYFYRYSTSESTGTRKVATFLFLCAGLGSIYMWVQDIRCQVMTTPYCAVWNTPSPTTYSGGWSYSSDSDYSSSSSSSYDGGGGSSNGGGYGD